MTQNLKFRDQDTLHRVALDNWTAAVNNGDFERAIALDQFHYNELVKKTEDVRYWDRWQEDTLAIRQNLTRHMERLAPSQMPATGESRRFLIVHHNYSGLAHETQLARNVAWLRAHQINVDIEIVYLFGEPDRRAHACQLYQLPAEGIHFLRSTSYQQAASRLHRIAHERQAQGIIYPTIFFMAFWMSLFVPHANQKFVQMKYYPLHAGRISRWAGGYRSGEPYYRIHGCDFEQLPILDLQLAKQTLPAVRQVSTPLTIGSISRPEKLSNADYNRFIADLLKDHPTLAYLYTGHPDKVTVLPPFIREHPRSHALGWVDPVSAISRFSIYLEAFPWGGGEMTLLALEAGLPYLVLETEESIRFGIYGFIRCIAEGQDPILQTSFCRTPAQLRERVAQLVRQPELRHQLGAAWRQAVHRYRPPSLDSWHSLFND